MNSKLFALCALLVLLSSTGMVQATTLLVIDRMINQVAASLLIYTVPSYGVGSTWYSPYSTNAAPPQFRFVATSDAVGGQRDIILGHVAGVPISSTAIMGTNLGKASVAFPLNWVGGAYFQWDGIDDAGSGLAFPGAALNPGLSPSIDFTFGGIAQGIALTITSDQQIDYRVTLVDSNGVRNQYQFFFERNEPLFGLKVLYYTDPIWTADQTFNYGDVAGIEIQIQTGTGASSNAPDTAFTSAFIFSFGITGNAGIRCNCGSAVNDQDLPNAQINLLTSPGGSTIRSTTTDANGDYSFFGLNPGTYQVCAQDTTVQYCTPRCSTVTIDPNTPTADYVVNIVKTQPVVFTVPPNVQGDCSDCKIPDGTSNCPPYATTTGCLGITTDVTVFEDVTTGTPCRLTIQRTFTSPDDGSKKTQTLTYTDTTPPQFSVNPSDESWPCNAITRTVNQWVAASADAVVVDDCSTTSITHNWNGLPVGSCNSVTVTFTPRDACGLTGTPQAATYSLTDGTGPTITTPASDVTVQCAAKTTSVQTSLTSWLNRHADAVATDNCSTATWTNNYSSLTPLDSNSCFDFVDVTFTVRDSCNNANTDVGRFTVQDTTSPVFTRNPQNTFQQCAGAVADQNALNAWLNTNAGATYTDACSTNDLDIDISNDYAGQVLDDCDDALVVTFTIQDACGNAPVSVPATFTVQDTLNPVITTPASGITVECDGFGNVDDFDSWVLNHGGARASDQCGGITWSDNSSSPPQGTCLDSVLVTFTATDDCGRSVNSQASFTVRDATDPVFTTLPQDASTECDANADSNYQDWLSNQAFAVGEDLCDSSSLISNTAGALVLGCNRANVVSFFIADTCNNVSPAATAAFTVVDSFDPVITVPGADLDLECNSVTNQGAYNSWLASNAGATAFDDCTSISWSNDGAQTLQNICNFSEVVTFTASDQCGHSTQFTQTATIIDNVAPVLLAEAVEQDIECDTVSNPNSAQLYQSWVAAHGFANARDDCTAVIWTDDAPSVLTGVDPCFATTFVTFTASDNCGASVSTQAEFTIRDTTPPVIIQAASTSTVQCDPNANSNQFVAFLQNHGGAVVQDACSAVTWTATFVEPPAGCDSEIVTFTADDGCGSTVVTTATFSIVDTINPTISTPAQNVQFECDGAGNTLEYQNYLATHGGAVASDVCATSLTWSNNALGTGPVGCGTENIVFSVVDSCGGRSSTTGTFRIVDTRAPVISPAASSQSAECDVVNNPVAIATWLVGRGGASATDICYSTGSLTWSNNYTSLVPLPCGAVATVTFTVRDPCGQSAGTTASFTVTDSLPPVITNPAQNLVLECNPATNNDETLTWVNSRASASASDSCSSVQWSNSFVATPDPCTGPYVVGFTAADACGNRATTTASVTIQDTVPPSFVNFPPDVRVVCDEVTDSSMTGIPGFTDSCFTADVIRTETDTVEVLPFQRLCPGDTIITRTWRITDACGNFAERDQLIVVSIPEGDCIPQPCIPCDEQPLLCCASSLAPVLCNPVECVPVDCTHTSCNTVPCLPVVCGNGSPPPFVDDDDVIAPSPRPQASDCEPIYIYVFDDDDGVTTQPVNTVSFASSASALTFSLFSLFLALLFLM